MAKARGRRNAIAGQFAARPIAMLESPAYRVLSRGGHQVLSRIEIELAHHGGKDNGALPVTYGDFIKYGLNRASIAPAIRELIVLGFVEVTRKGCAGNAEFRQPSLFRLTFRNAKGEVGDGSHEWRRIETIAQAEALAAQARLSADPDAIKEGKSRNKKQNPGVGFRQLSVSVSSTERP